MPPHHVAAFKECNLKEMHAEAILQLLQRSINHLAQIKQVHSILITNSFNIFNTSSRWVPTLLFNSLLRSYSHLGKPRETLLVFTHMVGPPNDLTFPPIIKASIAFPSAGTALHAKAIRCGVLYDPFIQTSFVSFYSQIGRSFDASCMFGEISRPCIVAHNAMLDAFCRNGEVGSAVSLFDAMPDRDVVSWTSIINGFGKNGYFIESIQCFKNMVEFKSFATKPNEATYVSVLSSCAKFQGGGALLKGRQIHGHIIRNEAKPTPFTATSLIDFYGKTGCPEKSLKVFTQVESKLVCTWNAMISSLACNSMERAALDMFDEMLKFGFLPNEVTFVAVFTACARGNFLDLTTKIYKSMVLDFGIIPTMEHYGCMVLVLGKSGLLKEAMELIDRMPFEADSSVLGALLSSCRIHGAIKIGTELVRKLRKIQSLHYGQYTALSSMNAELNDWNGATDLRIILEGSKVEKFSAYSLMETI